MREIIVRYNDGNDHMAVRGGEYIQDLVRCKDCRWNSECRMLDDDNGFCSDGAEK